jgi:hypothetical protein
MALYRLKEAQYVNAVQLTKPITFGEVKDAKEPTGVAGDYLIIDGDGTPLRVVKKDSFESRYEALEGMQ